jgi:hypothetical protein
LSTQGILTSQQVEVWAEFRPKLAHGKITDYSDDQLWEKRNILISTFNRLALYWLRYKGKFTEITSGSPVIAELNWKD